MIKQKENYKSKILKFYIDNNSNFFLQDLSYYIILHTAIITFHFNFKFTMLFKIYFFRKYL